MDSTTCPARSYKIALTLLFGASLLGMAATMIISARYGSPVTDRDYYENGLNYDRTENGERNPGLYWSMSASLSGGELLVRVQDEKGAPLEGGRLVFNQSAAKGSPLKLAETAPGLFRAPWPHPEEDRLQGTLRFVRGQASASRKVVFFH